MNVGFYLGSEKKNNCTLLGSTILTTCGPGSSVGIATGYGMDGPRIESWWGRDFPPLSRPALGPTQPPVQRVPCLSRGGSSSSGPGAYALKHMPRMHRSL